MNQPSPLAPHGRPDPGPPHRWTYYLLGALGLIALFAALAPSGSRGGYGARAGRYALTAADLANAGSSDAPGAPGSGPRSWIAGPGPVDFEQVFAVARTLPGVGAPDDRHVAAFGAADGREVFQVTVLYDDFTRAQALAQSSAVGTLSRTFGLSASPADLPGTADARRWTDAVADAGPGHDTSPGFEAFSFRIDGAIVFVGTRGLGAPTAAALAAVVRDRLIAVPPATATAPASASGSAF